MTNDPFRELDLGLLKVIEVVRDRVARGEIGREELVHFLEIVRVRIRNLVEPAPPHRGEDLTLHEKRQLARGLGARVDSALTALNDYLDSYFAEELDDPDKPN